jgi:orotate phosphoribosyltransferase
MRGTPVVVDDIVTTGATLAAVTARLREANVQVAGAAVLAATRRRIAPTGDSAKFTRGVLARADRHVVGSPNEG